MKINDLQKPQGLMNTETPIKNNTPSVLNCYHRQHELMQKVYNGDANIATITEIKKNISAISVFQTLVRQATAAIKAVIMVQ